MSLVVLSLLAGCGDGNGNDTAAAGDTVASAPAAMDTTAATATAPAAAITDPEIAAVVVAATEVCIISAEHANSNQSHENVKDFANRMITDHTAVNKQASDLVTKLNVTPQDNATSQALRQGGDDSRQQLDGLSGAAYDKAYMDHEVAYHQQVLDALDQTLIPGAQNAELKDLLQKTRPAIAAHLDMAKQIVAGLGS
jgi:putative membrane protein